MISVPNNQNTAEPRLVVPQVQLMIKGSPVKSPMNVVYSTAPVSAHDQFGTHYYVKGGDDYRIVLAEVVGHIMAGMVHVEVPQYAAGRYGGQGAPVFASAVIERAVRDVEIWIEVNIWN